MQDRDDNISLKDNNTSESSSRVIPGKGESFRLNIDNRNINNPYVNPNQSR